jgi:hypothetical protein
MADAQDVLAIASRRCQQRPPAPLDLLPGGLVAVPAHGASTQAGAAPAAVPQPAEGAAVPPAGRRHRKPGQAGHVLLGMPRQHGLRPAERHFGAGVTQMTGAQARSVAWLAVSTAPATGPPRQVIPLGAGRRQADLAHLRLPSGRKGRT